MGCLKTTTKPMRLPAKSKKVLCEYALIGKGTPYAIGACRKRLHRANYTRDQLHTGPLHIAQPHVGRSHSTVISSHGQCHLASTVAQDYGAMPWLLLPLALVLPKSTSRERLARI